MSSPTSRNTMRDLVRSMAALLAVWTFVGVPTEMEAQRRRTSPPPSGMVRIPAGRILPFYGGDRRTRVEVPSFALDVTPVTNAEFLGFVRANPRWRRSAVTRLFADEGYLSGFGGDLVLGERARPQAPVVYVSWFAARAYCASRGARLPNENEWEYVARADETRADAQRDPEFVRRILAWYSRPTTQPADVGSSAPNVYGVRDMHGLVWEWVEDFNASMVSADDRARDDDQASRFCGGAATGASDPADYAAFMRFAFRSSLRASYTVHNLGFRCARNLEESP